MTGRVIATPTPKHDCAPGWTTHYAPGNSRPFGPGWYSSPPSAYDYPKGTIWECPCGRTWVSTGPPAPNMPGVTGWRRERWWERHKRRGGEAS